MVWCPPATGAAKVVSYGHLLRRPDGHRRRAERLGDRGRAVQRPRLHVHRDRPHVRRCLRPHGDVEQRDAGADAQPRDAPRGKPQQVSYDQYSLKIGGNRVFVTAGEFDPWRTPSPSLWLDDLQKMKADGYSAVTVYFDWDYTSASPGVEPLRRRARHERVPEPGAAGGPLRDRARPGPYINAETDGGGIPSWVLTSPNGYCSDTEPYLSAALQWFSEIDAIIAPHQITNGGDVILYQIENEYTGTSSADLKYMAGPGAAGHVGRDRRAVHVQPVLRLGHVHPLGTGAVNISGQDDYPLGFDCADTGNFGQPYGYPSYTWNG